MNPEIILMIDADEMPQFRRLEEALRQVSEPVVSIATTQAIDIRGAIDAGRLATAQFRIATVRHERPYGKNARRALRGGRHD